MKSLALHLIVILLLGSLRLRANKNVCLLLVVTNTLSTATTSVVTTTTLQTPSLLAPRSSVATTLEMTLAHSTEAITSSTPTALRRRRQSTTEMPAVKQLLTHGKISYDLLDPPDPTTTFASTRLVRNANQTLSASGAANSVRQNRSFQSAAATDQRNRNNDKTNDINKYNRLERNQQFRMYQQIRGASSTTSTTGAITPTTATNHAQSLSAFMAHEQKESENLNVPLADYEADKPANKSTTRTLWQTPKTPRMIQRLVAGHIQNAEGRSTYEISAVTRNSTVTRSSTMTPPASYIRRKDPLISSSYRKATPVANMKTSISNPSIILNSASTITNHDQPNITSSNSTPRNSRQQDKLNTSEAENERDDDEALLDDPDDFDNWDNGILRLSAGSGKENSLKSKKNKDDSKKTLSEQVRDGKYGLIEKELFRREPKRPGILSYLPNKEVPIDNERNYGGLNEEDIWLAEDHLLVIKGGSLNKGETKEHWPAIDDYDAPGRQIKIPAHPKIPPPFPVQLEENGPVQFIGNSKFTVIYPVANESIPVYSAGPETYNTASESDSDDEKNLLTRPGSTKGAKENEQSPGSGYLYPAPYPPWLYHNQTFVNPFLNQARPITFPGLGPFPLARNGSLDKFNGTDDFDEDDPSLYYPPAYSFSYKSNYSNPVPPGPLVPGIVLPPPANQFSRLEKTEKVSTTTYNPPLMRHRVYSTSSSTSSTTTTSTTSTTSTTTEIPFRQIITKISEYKPKTIIITPSPPLVTSTAPTSPRTNLLPISSSPPTTTTTVFSPTVKAIRVPVAVPIPFYSDKNYPTQRNNLVSFVPTTPEPTRDTLSKSHPIYYEYIEAKRQRITTNAIDNFISTTAKPLPSTKPNKLYATSKRPNKLHGQRNYLQPINSNRQYDNIVYITPKPELQFNRPAAQAPVFKPRPIINNFEQEVNAIRETLRFYQNQQLRDNSIPRTPKSKPIYEYSFDATKNLRAEANADNFQPPTQFDEEPFKPMVTYSPAVDDENAFKAIAYDKVDEVAVEQAEQRDLEPRYQSTTTLVPTQTEQEQQLPQERSKKLRLRAKYLQQPFNAQYQQELPLEPQVQVPDAYQPTTPRNAWNKQELNEYVPQIQQQQNQQQKSERLQLGPVGAPLKNRGFAGYYYDAPVAPVRQNNRFFDEPFQNPVRKIINYRPQYAPQQQQQQQPPWNLENDTYVNYAPNRPPINPDAEFINPYQAFAYVSQGQRQPLPPISHQSQYYGPPQRYPAPPLPTPIVPRQQQQVPLHRDILVNYRQPLPPINPDSEFISHPQVLRNQENQYYRPNGYRIPQQVSDPANLYYIGPKYRRSNGAAGSNGGK